MCCGNIFFSVEVFFVNLNNEVKHDKTKNELLKLQENEQI